jgi:hypothetical protein
MWAGALLSFGLALVYPYFLNMFWEIPDGLEILRGHLPTSVSYALGPTHLVPQEWLFEAALAWAVQHHLYGLFTIVCALAAAATPLLVYAALRALGSNDVAAGIAAFLVVGSRFAGSTIRAETFAVDAFALEVLVLAGGARAAWALLAVAIWANLHASAVLAPFAAGVFAGGEALARGVTDARTKRAGAIAVLAALGTLLTPQGAGLWRYAFALAFGDNPVRRHLDVWHPLSFADAGALATVLPGLIVLLLLGVDLQRRYAPELGLAALGFVPTLMHERYETFLAVAWAPVLGRSLERIPALQRFSARRPATAMGVAIALLPVALYAALRVPTVLTAEVEPRGAWEDAAALVADNHLQGAAYVDYTWAAFLHWRGLPLRTLIDSHGDPYPKDVWDDHLALRDARPNWREVLERRHISVVVLPSDAPLVSVLALDPSWRAVGSRGKVTAYVRR